MLSFSSSSQHHMKLDHSSCLASFWRCLSYILVLFVFVLSLCQELSQCEANPIYACNICRNPPQGTRELVNGGKTFGQSNGVTMSCLDLQLSVQDVNPTSTGSAGEARLCSTAQYLAYLHCDCSGPTISPPTDVYKDPMPACDLCGGPGLDFNFVPGPNQDKLTDTRVAGQQNCVGLYTAAAQGVISTNLCPTIQQYSGPDCCNLGVIQPRQVSLPTPSPASVPTPVPTAPPISPPTPACLGVFVQCSTAGPPCCEGFDCRARAIGELPLCSAANTQTRTRITSNVGGAGGGQHVRGSTM